LDRNHDAWGRRHKKGFKSEVVHARQRKPSLVAVCGLVWTGGSLKPSGKSTLLLKGGWKNIPKFPQAPGGCRRSLVPLLEVHSLNISQLGETILLDGEKDEEKIPRKNDNCYLYGDADKGETFGDREFGS